MRSNNSELNKLVVSSGIALLLLVFSAHKTKAQHHDSTPLSAPGNQIFGAIQETITALEKNPSTDWEQVNLEALRQHLLDMKAFTEEVEVLEKQPIEQGVELRVRPFTERGGTALERVLSMHPMMLNNEKGWTMESEQNNGVWTITCTTPNSEEVPKVRALGYIGLLAAGAHHQHHHWMIATGQMAYPQK